MGASPASIDMSPVAEAFCQKQTEQMQLLFTKEEKQYTTNDVSWYSHFVDNRFLKKQIVHGQDAVFGVEHLIRISRHSNLNTCVLTRGMYFE